MDTLLSDLTVVMSAELANARQDLSLVELRVARAGIAKLNAGQTADGTDDVWLSAKEYAQIYGMSVDDAYMQLKGAAATLPSKRIVFQGGTSARWVEAAEYPDRMGALRLRF